MIVPDASHLKRRCSGLHRLYRTSVHSACAQAKCYVRPSLLFPTSSRSEGTVKGQTNENQVLSSQMQVFSTSSSPDLGQTEVCWSKYLRVRHPDRLANSVPGGRCRQSRLRKEGCLPQDLMLEHYWIPPKSLPPPHNSQHHQYAAHTMLLPPENARI